MHIDEFMLLIGVALSLVGYIWGFQRLWKLIRSSESPASFSVRLLRFMPAVPVLAMSLMPIPLPLFYVLLFLANLISQSFSAAPKKCRQIITLLSNMRFLLFTAPHLIVLGLLSLAAQTDVLSVINNRSLRMVSLLIVVLLGTGLVPIFTHSLVKDNPRSFDCGSGELRLFARFTVFCVCSVILDSIPCLFYLPTKFSVLFLIGSNTLLLLMAFLFAGHVYTVIRDASVLEEYLRLREEALEQRCRTARLERDAYLDALTGIYSRAYIQANLTNMLKNQETLILIFLDLDGLKQINDCQGHLAGDRYLQNFSGRMRASLRPNDVFARYGGDEFLILIPDCPLQTAALRFAQIQADFTLYGLPFSYGLVQAQPDRKMSAEEWIAEADRAMYKDKKKRHTQRKGD